MVVADNDQTVLDLLLLDFRLEGYDVVATAMTGDDAVRACEDERPDVLVVDYRLGPGINGVDVARRVTPHGARVVVFTNYVNPEVVDAAADAGAVVIEKGNLNALRRAVAG